MSALTNHNEFVGVGVYSLSDASRLLKIRPGTIRRWMLGYTRTHQGSTRHYEQLWAPDLRFADGTVELSFRDLIELRFINAFLNAGLAFNTVRRCLEEARTIVNSARPFSTNHFRTDGKTIFLERVEKSRDPILIDLRNRQYNFPAIIRQTFRDLDIEDKQVRRWRPFHGKRSIIIDPARSFGQPIATDSGVPTIALADAVVAEGSVKEVARLYEVSLAVVKDAVAFHTYLAAA